MTRREVAFYLGVLIVLGAGWGITQPLAKIAVSTGFRHFGLVFWQLAIGSLLMATLCALRRKPIPLGRGHIRLYVILALIGTVLPNSASYQAAVHLPAGILSLLLSMVPMWAFPIALGLGLDRFSVRRVAGLVAGLCGVLLIVAPGTSFETGLPPLWVLVGLIAGVFYAVEGNVVAKWGLEGLDPIQVMAGASLTGSLIALPLALSTGQFIAPEHLPSPAGQALVASSITHTLVYTAYVWLVGRTGPVFAVQVSYLVTGFGILWAKLLLGESYAPTVWAALAAMFIGMYLVQPRPKAALAEAAPIGEHGV